MAINPERHNFVVVMNSGEFSFGRQSVSECVAFVESQLTPDSKTIGTLANFLSEGVNIDGNDFNVYDIESYLETFEDEDDNE